MTVLIGLTGSIGMGKSTTAQIFANEGCAVWDADAAVHRLYAKYGDAVAPMQEAFPDAIINGAVSREKLKKILRQQPEALRDIERIVHPLVAADRADFIENAASNIVVLDIPLLFETGADKAMDVTVCVSIDADTQKARVMARGHMTEQDFQTVLSKQMSDEEKRKKADYVVTTETPESAAQQVKAILGTIREQMNA